MGADNKPSETPICDSQAIYMKDAASHGEDMPDSVIDARIARQLELSNVALRKALEPFANAACPDEGVSDDMLIEDCTELTEGHLRKARAALQGGK